MWQAIIRTIVMNLAGELTRQTIRKSFQQGDKPKNHNSYYKKKRK